MPGTFDGRLAFASVLFAAPGAPAFRTQSGDFASVAVVGGVTRLTFQDPIAPYQGFPSLTLRSATGGYASVVDWTSTYLDIETLDTTGAAAEIEFDLTIVQQTVAFVVPPAPPPPPPAPPSADLIGWWRADDISQPDNTDINSWTDRSGNTGPLTSFFGTNPPKFAASSPSFSGQPAANFINDGNVRQLRSLLPPNYPVGSGAFSLYVVHDPILSGSIRPIFGWGINFNARGRMCAAQFNAGAYWIVVGEGYASSTDSYVVNAGPQILSIFSATGADMNVADVWVDGAVPGPPDGPGTALPWNIPNPVPEVNMGGLPQENSVGYIGQIAEVLVYSKDHSPAERTQTLAYLSARYGIPVP